MRWQVRWDERDPGTGKVRRPGRKFPTEAKAKNFAKLVNAKFDSGSSAPSTDGKKIFRDVGAEWQASRLDVKRSHLDRAERELRTWVYPRFGAREVGSITKAEVQKFAAALRQGTATANYNTGVHQARQPLAATSARSIIGQVRGVMEYALDNELMTTSNPVRKIKTGKIVKSNKIFLDFEQVALLKNLVQALPQGDQHVLATEVMATAGLRIGEALLLRVGDVNPVKRRITVARSWTTEGTKWVTGTTKTGETREVPVSAALANALVAFAKDMKPNDYLFRGPRGSAPWQPDNWRARVFRRAIAGTEFEEMGLTPHGLRHTAASAAIASGAEATVVQRMLGHASPIETWNTYTHLWEDRLDTVTEAVEAARAVALGGAS